jgi:hypothetical protein
LGSSDPLKKEFSQHLIGEKEDSGSNLGSSEPLKKDFSQHLVGEKEDSFIFLG